MNRKLQYLLPKNPKVLFHFKNGITSGFPTCCIIWYCTFAWLPDWVFNPPVNFWRRLGVPEDLRQFVPCPHHYTRGLDLHVYTVYMTEDDMTEDELERYRNGSV